MLKRELKNSGNSAGTLVLQVIVVVFENLEVWCFDHKLSLLWRASSDVPVDFSFMNLKSIAALVTSHTLNGTSGTIYVGGSYVATTHDAIRCVDGTLPFYLVSLDGNDGSLNWHNFDQVRFAYRLLNYNEILLK